MPMIEYTEARNSRRPLTFATASIWERARELSKDGRHEDAIDAFQRLTDVDPTDLTASLKLAHHCVAADRYDRAADEYLRLAAVYARLGHPQRAMTVAMRALQLEPSRVVRSRLAPVVESLGSQATALCERVSRVHLLRGRREDARDVLELLVHSVPTTLSRRLELAELDLASGRMTEALEQLRLVAGGLRSLGRTPELVRVLEMMHAHGGPQEVVLRELAAVYMGCGQPRRALGKLEALHRIVPEDRATVERLARIHASLGQLQLTLDLLDRLASLIVEQADRGELRAMLRRAASWCSDMSYQRSIEELGIRVLRLGGRPATPRRASAGQAGPRRRGAVPPPLPRWTRRPHRALSATGEIHVLDGYEIEELELDEHLDARSHVVA